MVDFTSALYLGLQHSSDSLGPWTALTLGRPAAVREPPDAGNVAAALARLQGCEAAVLVPSTLHLFWDLFGVLGRERVAVFCDAEAYPIARWGAERARAAGAAVRTFPHRDDAALEALIAAHPGVTPIVVADGYCVRCGEASPLTAYAALAQRGGGYLVIDDTQALGILGEHPDGTNPYGWGGGGSLRWHGTYGDHIITCSSLAKGFGAPVAALAGARPFIDRFQRDSETRVHCSPPSVAAVRAARRALETNASHGDALRRRLLHLVGRLRARAADAGLPPTGRLPFPVQTFVSARRRAALLHSQLLADGIVGLLTTTCRAVTAGLTLLVTAGHALEEIEQAASAIGRAVRGAEQLTIG